MNGADALGLGALAREARRLWTDVVALAPGWGLRVLAVLLLAALVTLVYRLARRGETLLARRFPAGSPWIAALDPLLRLTAVAVFLVSSSSLFSATAGFTAALLRVYVVAALLYLGWAALGRVLERGFHALRLDASLELLTRNILRAVWLAVSLYLVFAQFGINLLPILGGLGVAGIALGFAAQDLLSNLIAGITLLLDRPFTLGDWIQVEGEEGEVQRVTLRTTRLRTRDNALLSVPNSKIAAGRIVNLTAGGPLRVRASVGVDYGADLDAARAALEAVLRAETLVLGDPAPRVAVVELADSAVTLDLIYWIAPESIARRPQTQQRILEAAKRALDGAGVRIPFPQLDVHLRREGGTGP